MSVYIRTPIKYLKLIEIEYYCKPWPYTLPHTKERHKKFQDILKVRLVKYVVGVFLDKREFSLLINIKNKSIEQLSIWKQNYWSEHIKIEKSHVWSILLRSVILIYKISKY